MSNHHHHHEKVLTMTERIMTTLVCYRRLCLLIHRQKQQYQQKKKNQRMIIILSLLMLLFFVVLLRLMLFSSSSSSPSSSPKKHQVDKVSIKIVDTDTIIQIGEIGSASFSLKSKQYDSWWHDVPIRPTTTTTSTNNYIVNMVVEIPFGTKAKMEMDKYTKFNPIKQDLNKIDGSLRYYSYGTTFFNYGFVPQTWEDPVEITEVGHDGVFYGGDNDPIDIIEIGSTHLEMGNIIPCRIIGGYELIDQNEIDYKIICVTAVEDDDEEDTTTRQQIQSLDDLEPGIVEKLKDWFINYKTTDGKQPNKFVNPDTPLTSSEAMDVVIKTHNSWRSQLCGRGGIYTATNTNQHYKKFWLSSPKCRG